MSDMERVRNEQKPRGSYTDADREYVKYCLRYAVRVLGITRVLDYLAKLDANGDEVKVLSDEIKAILLGLPVEERLKVLALLEER
jgi:hypothetical protein